MTVAATERTSLQHMSGRSAGDVQDEKEARVHTQQFMNVGVPCTQSIMNEKC
jgi:hypothetical protein